MEMKHRYFEDPIVRKIAEAEECVWLNPHLRPAEAALAALPYSRADVEDAALRLARAPRLPYGIRPASAARRLPAHPLLSLR